MPAHSATLTPMIGPEWSSDEKFAEIVLVVEDELVPVIWTQLQVDKVCLSTYTNTCWNDWLENYLLCGVHPLEYDRDGYRGL